MGRDSPGGGGGLVAAEEEGRGWGGEGGGGAGGTGERSGEVDCTYRIYISLSLVIYQKYNKIARFEPIVY